MRLPDWEQRLAAYIAGAHGAAFAWGKHDCVRFAAGAVEAVTGERLLPRVQYRSQAGAYRALKELGFASVAEAVPLPPVALAFAARGDVVAREDSLGVAVGRDALFVGEEGGEPGLVRFPVLTCDRAWKVG
jgi:hypothetical protein